MTKNRKNPLRSAVGMLLIGAGLAGLGTTYFKDTPEVKMGFLGAGMLVLIVALVRVLRQKDPS